MTTTSPTHAAAPIAVLQGATGEAIQALLADFAASRGSAVRVVGVVEEVSDGCGLCGPGTLRNISEAVVHPLYQDLGPGSDGCAIDPSGVVLAGELVRRQIAAGCDLVVLSKFGKLEAESGSGLMAAFIGAVEAGVPVLTSVSPRFEESWTRFAAPLFVRLPAEVAAIEGWWRSVR